MRIHLLQDSSQLYFLGTPKQLAYIITLKYPFQQLFYIFFCFFLIFSLKKLTFGNLYNKIQIYLFSLFIFLLLKDHSHLLKSPLYFY